MSEEKSQSSYWVGAMPTPPNPWDIEKRVSLLEQSTENIRNELSQINNNITKLVWIVLTAVIMTGLKMILN